MATNFLWSPGTSNNGLLVSAITLMTTELQSVATGSGIISSVNGASGVFTNANTGQAVWADIFFNVGNPAFTASAGGNVAGWFLTSPDATTFEPTTVIPARAPDFLIPFPTAALTTGTQYRSSGMVMLPALKFMVFVQNNAGATLGSGATTAPSLKAAPYTLQY